MPRLCQADRHPAVQVSALLTFYLQELAAKRIWGKKEKRVWNLRLVLCLASVQSGKRKRERENEKEKGKEAKEEIPNKGKRAVIVGRGRWYQCQEKKRQLVVDVRNEDTDVMRSTRNGVMSGVSFPTKTQKPKRKKKRKKEPDE